MPHIPAFTTNNNSRTLPCHNSKSWWSWPRAMVTATNSSKTWFSILVETTLAMPALIQVLCLVDQLDRLTSTVTTTSSIKETLTQSQLLLSSLFSETKTKSNIDWNLNIVNMQYDFLFISSILFYFICIFYMMPFHMRAHFISLPIMH